MKLRGFHDNTFILKSHFKVGGLTPALGANDNGAQPRCRILQILMVDLLGIEPRSDNLLVVGTTCVSRVLVFHQSSAH